MRLRSTRPIARLTRVEHELTLHCHYPPALVEALKSWIPAPWRAWDYEQRCWRVHGSQEPVLRAVLHALDYQVEEGGAAHEREQHAAGGSWEPSANIAALV